MKPYQVEFKIHEDDATGDYGLIPKNTIDAGFNSFWSGQGIFHDVFEHYFEDKHKYFQNSFAFNLGGEVAAMGHLFYYWYNYRLQERQLNPNSIWTFDQSIVGTTRDDMAEAITDGYTNFGDVLACKVPRQSRSYKEEKQYWGLFSYIIDEHWAYIKDVVPASGRNLEEEAKEYCYRYKKSVTYSKIRDLYMWGYKQAGKIMPYSEENQDAANEFLIYWKRFCDKVEAKELSKWVDGVTFKVYPGLKMKWKATFHTHEGNMTPNQIMGY